MHTHSTPSVGAFNILLHVLLIEILKLLIKRWVFFPNLISVSIYLLELFRKIRQTVKEFFDYNNAKHEPFAISSEGFNHEFQSNALQHRIQEVVLYNSSKQFSNLLQVWLRIFMQETIFIKQSMQHARVDLLLFDNLRFLEILQSYDQFLDPFVNLVRFGSKYVLEVLICGLVNFLCTLSG